MTRLCGDLPLLAILIQPMKTIPMTTNKQPLLLIDGSSYFYRAFHALPPLSNSKGNPTGAVYGVINMIKRLMKDYESSHMAVVFDAKGKTFRDDLYAEYKANREKMPDELSVQFPPLIELIKAMGLPLLIVDGVEADDVIGTLARQATEQGIDTVISTGDKDIAQLVNKHVTLVNTMTNKTMDIAGVEEKFGVPPELIIDYLTLIGDKSDNIPGVDKVGPKTAVKWLKTYGDLDGILEHADEITGKVGENLRASLMQIPLSKTLVTIKQDLELPLSISDLNCQAEDKAALIELVRELEFKTWLNQLLDEQPVEAATEQYTTILSEAEFLQYIEQLKLAKLIAFDTETTSLEYMQAEIVGVSFAMKANEAVYIPCGHDYENAPAQLSRDFVLKTITPILEDPTIEKVGQNLKYDMNVLGNYHITMQGVRFDTMLESYVLNSGASRHDMDTLALKYLGKNTIHFEDIAGKGAKQKTFNQIDLAEAGPYAAEDADVTLQLHETLWPKFENEKGMRWVFENIEMPLVGVLSSMERNGVLINENALAEQSQELAIRLNEIEQEAYAMVGEEFNLNSPKQLQAILFEKMNLPIVQKTPKGQPSTAESVLQELALDYPLPKLILEYRSLSKLKSTYTDALPLRINPKTGRVHTSYNQAVTATGRLSSTDPNLQNIPVRTEAGRRIRHAFVAPQGYKIISADYSQIELRIMAHISGDPTLTAAFHNGHDIHSATAAEVLGISIDDVTSEQRRSAKAINFGLIYGMSSFGLAKQLGTSREEAQAYIDKYFDRYPKVLEYMDKTRELAHETGYVETHFGRRLYLPEINARNFQRQKAAERAAINAPLQGTAADIIKLAMIAANQWISATTLDVKMIMQVHDELVFEVAEKDVEQAKAQIQKIMCETVDLGVPLEVDAGVGDTWDDAH